ncbi:MAG: SAM-dependent methyltransferase [Planctomycetes bacterium RBG_16_59_8]|nr:MAG: SAM-dependent methyltransferase [Planctomycetes bacterium RBG_16_59_8]
MFHPKGPSFCDLAIQSLSSTERGYDLLAPKFDYTPFRTPEAVLRAAASSIGNISSALDLCCGTGAAMRMLRPLCSRMVVGIDRSRGMVAEARRRLEEDPGTAPLHLVRGDAFALPFGEAFDVVTCFGALGHILPRDHGRFVRSIRRVLHPGGRFIFAASTLPPRWSRNYWILHGFDLAMKFRNAFLHPAFHMYYVNFLLPDALALLEREGYSIDSCEPIVPRADDTLHLVIATKCGEK